MLKLHLLLLLGMLLGPLVPHAQQDTTYTESPVTITDSVVAAPEAETQPDYSLSHDSDSDTTWAIAKPGAADSSRVAVRPLPGKELDEARADDDYWYWNYREKHRKRTPATRSRPLKPLGIPSFVFWTLIGIALVALLHFFLLSININVFGKQGVDFAGDEEPEAADDIFGRDFERELALALTSGDYRLAVRLRYLQLLRELSDRNIIQYRPGTSNGAYVSQLRGSEYYNDFFRITRTFEYAWYGMLPVTGAAYERMQQDVAHLKTRFA